MRYIPEPEESIGQTAQGVVSLVRQSNKPVDVQLATGVEACITPQLVEQTARATRAVNG